jgi:hypothetical protein
MKVSIELPPAASAFASDSVEGQRSRPSGVMRLDLLKVVGSRPERRASRSSAAQTWPWVSIRGIFGCLAMRNSRAGLGIISRIAVLRRGLPGGA